MGGLIEELSEQASDPATKVGPLLRRMKIATVRLGLDELESWVDHELTGYGHDDPLPDYRFIHGMPQNYHSHWGWRHMKLSSNSDDNLLWSVNQYRGPIDGLESMMGSEGPFRLTYPEWLEGMGLSQMPHGITKLGLYVDRAQLVNVVNATRGKVLDWSLTMEKAGVTGEGMSFTNEEKRAAQNVTYHIDMRGGQNNRANINSTDNSANTAVGGDLFGDLRSHIASDVPEGEERQAILKAVDAMEAQKGNKAGFAEAYGRFMQSAANHIQVVQPFITRIGDFLGEIDIDL